MHGAILVEELIDEYYAHFGFKPGEFQDAKLSFDIVFEQNLWSFFRT